MIIKAYLKIAILMFLIINIGCSNFIDDYAIIDTESPIVELFNTPPDITNNNTINITVGGIDVVAYKYNIDNSGWTDSFPTDIPINIINLIDGMHTLEVIGVDKVGNWQSTDNPTIYTWLVDTQSPQVMFSINNNDEYTRKPTVTLTINSNEMDVLSCSFSNDGLEWSDVIPCVDTIQWNLTPANGVESKSVYARFYDLAGNIFECHDDIDYIQYLAPVIYFAFDNSGSMVQNIDNLKKSIEPYFNLLLSENFYIGFCIYNSTYKNSTPYTWIIEKLNPQIILDDETFLNAFPPPFDGTSTPGFALMSILDNNLLDIDDDRYSEIRPKIIILVADGPFDNNPYGHTVDTAINYASLSCTEGIPVLVHGVNSQFGNDKNKIAIAGQGNISDAAYYTNWADLFGYVIPKLQTWAEEGDDAKWCCK